MGQKDRVRQVTLDRGSWEDLSDDVRARGQVLQTQVPNRGSELASLAKRRHLEKVTAPPKLVAADRFQLTATDQPQGWLCAEG